MIPFWYGYDCWLQSHGMLLYKLRPPPGNPGARFWYPSRDTVSSTLPFARCLNGGSSESEFSTGLRVMPRFAYAQDGCGRDLFIKLIEKGSNEHKINRHLLSNASSSNASEFSFVLPPVALLDSPYDFSFLVMPRFVQTLSTVRQVLTFMKCLLTGLAFLHEQRIAHRDINISNVLVNCYCQSLEEWKTEETIREYIQTSDEVAYALFDFDLSVQFPLDTDIRSARRPSREAFRGAPIYHPSDVWCGPPGYNPFAFDVACLGNLFLYHFASMIPTVPALAPLYACMTTHVVEQRFTASEALAFYLEHLERLPDEVQRREVVLRPSCDPLNNPDLFWQLLGTEDEARWSQYRVPPRPWGKRFLTWLASLPRGWMLLHRLRCTLHI
ncbi:hypothetical protein BV20DRAFT_1066263 [Pilatotrama ljubarskyi]|nr:hypothetical protein BV20DRAFT_1066263 [Pilatotrama ljubarskyi]